MGSQVGGRDLKGKGVTPKTLLGSDKNIIVKLQLFFLKIYQQCFCYSSILRNKAHLYEKSERVLLSGGKLMTVHFQSLG